MDPWALRRRSQKDSFSIPAASMRRLLALLSQAPAWGHDDRFDDDRSDVERHTHLGTVVGVDDSATTGTYAWKGVPFAKAPVGALRWKAPVDPA